MLKLKKMKFDKQNIFFIGDTHFEHKNVIKYDKRPFGDTYHMRDEIIKNWNNAVSNNDIVYFMGDFSFGGSKITTEIANQLNGIIYLIQGNHDNYKTLKKTNRFEKIYEYGTEIYVKDEDIRTDRNRGYQMIVLSHYPILVWNKHHVGSWMLHAHTHGSLMAGFKDSLYQRKIMDMGCNLLNYTPISYGGVKSIMSEKIITKVDHHGKK